ncbi:MAG: alpha/beta fold hydrolase [Candidatus Promineifilaceae bacterium]
MSYTVEHSCEDGIERIVYRPLEKRFETPIVMQHGMWHGAWCWEPWQKLLAEWGWESHAHSLPGHGQSPVQRPIRWCTLGYYLEFLQAEVARMTRPPVLMGHSMGGALAQWYLRQVGDLPAAVLVAPWLSHSMMGPILRTVGRDAWGLARTFLHLTTTPLVRNPYRAAQMFIHEGALFSPEALHARLGPESMWVLLQYNPPFWFPAQQVNTPLLWLAGAADTLISEAAERRSAAHYSAEYVVVPEAGHNLMMEKGFGETAVTIHNWLLKQEL